METSAEPLSLVALLLSVAAVLGSALAWHFSRAQKVRAFEHNIAQLVEAWTGKIQAMELRLQQQQTTLGDTLEAVTAVLERITLERKRVVQANTQAAKRDEDPEADVAPVPQTREQQLAVVNQRFAGRAA